MSKPKARENYGNGSVAPETVVKKDKNGHVVIDKKTGKPVRAQKKDRQGRPIWRVAITLGVETYTDSKGNRRKRQVKKQTTVHGTLDDARKVCKQMASDYEHIDTSAARMTFADAVKKWEASMKLENSCAPSKLRDHMTRANYIAEQLGSTLLIELKRGDMESALSALQVSRNMSEQTMRNLFFLARRILTYCVDNKWMASNPMQSMKAPRVTTEAERRSMSIADCAKFRAALDRDERMAYEKFAAKELRQADAGNMFGRTRLEGMAELSGLIALRILIATGLRRGEALGIRWKFVDFENCTIRIEKAFNKDGILKKPKTTSGKRNVSVDPETMSHLYRWMLFQQSKFHLINTTDKNGKTHPLEWSGDSPVCCNGSGNMLEPRNLNRWWNKYRVEIGFPTLLLHELRHTAASIALGSGVDIETVKNALGHSKASVTLNTYGHALKENNRGVANVMGNVLYSPAKAEAEVKGFQKSA